MNRCMYEPVRGLTPNCNGACKLGNKICPYYFIDEVYKVFNEWRKDAGVDTPILWRFDRKRNKVCLYTTRPGYFIGLHGERYQRFMSKLREVDKEKFAGDVDIVECDDGI